MAFDTNYDRNHSLPVQTASLQDADQNLSVPTSEVYATTAPTNAPIITQVDEVLKELRTRLPELREAQEKIEDLLALAAELGELRTALDDCIATDALGNPRWEKFLAVDLTSVRRLSMVEAADVCIEIAGEHELDFRVRMWIADVFVGIRLGRFPIARRQHTSHRYLREFLREIAQSSESKWPPMPERKERFMRSLVQAVREAQAKARLAVQDASSAGDLSDE